MVDISFIIPVRNDTEALAGTLLSIFAATSRAKKVHEIILVDDASERPLKSMLPDARDLTIVRSDSHIGVAKARNLGADHAVGETLCFLDADICLSEESLEEFLKHGLLQRPAIWGGTREEQTGERHYGLRATLRPRPALAWNGATPRENPAFAAIVPASCLLLKRSLFFDLGKFEESFDGFGSLEDCELCLRAKSFGYPILLVPTAIYRHHESEEKREAKKVLGDEYYAKYQENLARLLYLHSLARTGIRHRELTMPLLARKKWIRQRTHRRKQAASLLRPEVPHFDRAIICDHSDIGRCGKSDLLLASSASVLEDLRQAGHPQSRLLQWYSGKENDSQESLADAAAQSLCGTTLQQINSRQLAALVSLAPLFQVQRTLKNLISAEDLSQISLRLQNPLLRKLFHVVVSSEFGKQVSRWHSALRGQDALSFRLFR